MSQEDITIETGPEILEARSQWFNQYCTRIDEGVLKPQIAGTRYACPCCRYPTLDERGGYEICQLCNWEDDGQDDPHANEVWGGPNSYYSLSLARENFTRYWSKHSAECERDNSPAELAAKKSIAAAYDAMPQADDKEIIRLQKRIKSGEKILYAELEKRIQVIEAAARTVHKVKKDEDISG